MTFSLTFWELISLVIVMVGAVWTGGRVLVNQFQRAIDEKFQTVSAALKGQDEATRRLERDLMELKAELPRDYVRREDYTQAIATIMTKIDHVAMRMEAAIREAYTDSIKRERA